MFQQIDCLYDTTIANRRHVFQWNTIKEDIFVEDVTFIWTCDFREYLSFSQSKPRNVACGCHVFCQIKTKWGILYRGPHKQFGSNKPCSFRGLYLFLFFNQLDPRIYPLWDEQGNKKFLWKTTHKLLVHILINKSLNLDLYIQRRRLLKFPPNITRNCPWLPLFCQIKTTWLLQNVVQIG